MLELQTRCDADACHLASLLLFEGLLQLGQFGYPWGASRQGIRGQIRCRYASIHAGYAAIPPHRVYLQNTVRYGWNTLQIRNHPTVSYVSEEYNSDTVGIRCRYATIQPYRVYLKNTTQIRSEYVADTQQSNRIECIGRYLAHGKACTHLLGLHQLACGQGVPCPPT